MSAAVTKLIMYVGSGLVLFLGVFFFGKKSGEKKADQEISDFKAYAEDEIRKANNETVKAKAEAQKLSAEKSLVKEASKIVSTPVQSNTGLKQEVQSALTREEMKSVLSKIIADSTKRAQEASKRYE